MVYDTELRIISYTAVTNLSLFCTIQTFTVTLTGAYGGARITDSSTASISILSNDSPYGFVSFDSPTFTTAEETANSVAVVPIVRRCVYVYVEIGATYIGMELCMFFTIHIA